MTQHPEPDDGSDAESELGTMSNDSDYHSGGDIEAMNIDSGADQKESSRLRDYTRSPITSFQVVVPTLEELGYDRDNYRDFGNQFIGDEDKFPEDSRIIRIIKEIEKDNGALWYQAIFGNGRVMEVPFERLTKLNDGSNVLQRFLNDQPQHNESVDVTGSSEDRPLSPVVTDVRKIRQKRLLVLQDRRSTQQGLHSAIESSNDDNSDEGEMELAPARRSRRTTRSQGLKQVEMLSYKVSGDYSDDDEAVISNLSPRQLRKSIRTSGRGTASQRRKRLRLRDDSSEEYETDDGSKRRSGRTKRQRPSYAEGNVDDIFETRMTIPAKPKIIHSKEIFPVLDEEDGFMLVHNLHCSVCQFAGHSKNCGKLVCCQGCSASFHKECIGQRATREHLVTKISDQNFILQCKRCIGRYRLKDPLQAFLDRCSECNSQGRSCAPFKPLTGKKAAPSHEREVTPNIDVSSELLYNSENILFRCSNCYRAWHYEHLPQRGSKKGRAETGSVRQHRIEQYTKDFQCVDCLSSPGKISTIIAWRPLDLTSHQGGVQIDLNDFNEDEREYLVKFEEQSYFHAQWYPGSWVSGAFPMKRLGFTKNHPPAVVTWEEAIEESWLRVEIVLNVQYTSYVPLGNDVDIDLARIKEVSRAYVKYKGLGYDEVFWDEPPKESDNERWVDWRRAYDDYIHGLYVKPSKNTTKKTERARRTNFKNLELKGQPKYIKGGTLMEYQMEGMNWLYYKWWKDQNAILADEMGLGKTIQIVSFLAVLFEQQKLWPFLIVVPHSTVPNWKREIQTWVPNLRVVAYYGADAARKLSRQYEMFHKNGGLKCHIVVTSYTTPTTDAGVLRRIPWRGLIVDEGQRLKNDATLLYTELQKYKINHKVLLTGTPLQNNPRELFNLLQFLQPEKMNAQRLDEEYGILTNENVPRLHALIRPFFLRRTKAQVLTHLPPMAEVIVLVSMTALQRKLYKSILSKDVALVRSILHRGDKLKATERATLNNLLMQLRKCVCHPFLYNENIEEITDNSDMELIHRNLVEAGSKLDLLNIMLPKLKARGHRVLLFSQFLGMLDIIEDFLNGLGLKFHRLDGSISTLDKQKRIDEFNAPGSDFFAFLLSTRAGGVGINLATADTVIILDPDFNPHQDIQALSRAHRIGQKNKVLVFHLMTRDTCEERIMQIGKKKISLDHLIIERMGVSGEDGEKEEVIDVESILSFGAKRLFEDDAEDRVIKYDDESVDKLLDRSNIEQTKTSNEDGDGAENAFSFARVWVNDKGMLEENAFGSETPEDSAPELGFWEKIIKEREDEASREAQMKEQELGRGRRRKTVNYALNNDDEGNDSDTDFQADGHDPESEDSESEHRAMVFDGEDMMLTGRSTNGIVQNQPNSGFIFGAGAIAPIAPMIGLPPLPYQAPARPPLGVLPHLQFKQPSVPDNEFKRIEIQTPTDNPVFPLCRACKFHHIPGSCTLKTSGIEYCPMCKLPHLPKLSACPHFGSMTQIDQMINALSQSTEDRALVDEAKRLLKQRKGYLQKAKEKKLKEAKEGGVVQRPPQLEQSRSDG